MAMRLSAISTGRLLPQGTLLVLISVRCVEDPVARAHLERLLQLKNTMTSLRNEPQPSGVA
jgi:hypothetical protein